MEMMKRYRQLKNQFSEVADFAVVYIEEAHPVDGWAFKVTYTLFLFSSAFPVLLVFEKGNLNNLLTSISHSFMFVL